MIVAAKFELPKHWKWATLEDISSLERGKFSPRPRNDPRYYGGTYPWIQTGEVEASEKYIRTYRNTLNELGLSVSKIFPRGTLVITIAATIGAVGILDFDSCMPDSLVGITPKANICDTEFLYYLLLTLRERVRGIATQSAQANINLELLKPLRIPLPPLDEQKRIASIAQKCDRLHRTRRYTQQLSDSYLRSVFLEMFGNLETNSKEWEFSELGDVANIASGVTKGQKFNGKKTVTVPYLRVANVQDGYLDLSEIKTIEALPSEVEELTLQKGDVLMTEGGDFDKLGRGAIWNGQIKNCIHQNHIFRVRTHKDMILPNFFASLLMTRFAKLYFLRCSKQTTNLATINMTQLKGLPVPIPPLSLQEKFAQVVQRFERLRIQQREADRQAEHLFQTVLYRAFRGEL